MIVLILGFIMNLLYVVGFRLPSDVQKTISKNGASSGVPELPQIQKPPSSPVEETTKELPEPKNEATTPVPGVEPPAHPTPTTAEEEEEEEEEEVAAPPPDEKVGKPKTKGAKIHFVNEWPGH